MAEKMKQNIILKILDAVRKTAVKGAYSPSLKGMFEKGVPGKLRGMEEQRIDDPFNNCLWFGAVVYIAMVMSIASVIMSL